MPRGHRYLYRPYFVPQRRSAHWFQRPYPYHFDYYRQRYGGTYAPYYGNLYGPPAVGNYYYGGSLYHGGTYPGYYPPPPAAPAAPY